MLKESLLEKILASGKPEPKNIPWYGEPNMGCYYDENEINAAIRVLEDSMHWSIGFGPNPIEINEFEKEFAKYCNVEFSIAVSNNGDGFDMILQTMDLKPGDEIITPVLNFKAWHMAILRYGCKLVFCDIDPETLNIDPNDVEKRITKNTRAICPVHLAGVSCRMDELEEIANSYSHKKYGPIKIIGDAARATGVNYKKTKVGKKGWATVFSFHSAKLMTTLGEGGMITTDDQLLAESLYQMRNYGGEENWGMNYRISKVQAAVGLQQLKKLDDMNSKRVQVANRRTKYLSGIEELTLPESPSYSNHVYYLYPIQLNSGWGLEERNFILKMLESKYGIICSIPKNIYNRWKYIQKNSEIPLLPETEKIENRIICPIMHPEINEEQELYISSALINSLKLLKEKGIN